MSDTTEADIQKALELARSLTHEYASTPDRILTSGRIDSLILARALIACRDNPNAQ